MRFLVDMNLSPAVAVWLQSQGHDAVHLRETGLQTASDAVVFARAAEEGRILVTVDLDFGEIVAALARQGSACSSCASATWRRLVSSNVWRRRSQQPASRSMLGPSS